jgi:Polysaccharide pyruvyl transferase
MHVPNPNILPKARKNHPLEIITEDSLENWLYGIDNAHLVVADSFHAVCFSIILRTNFIAILRRNAPLNGRFETLLNLLGIKGRIVYVGEEVNFEELIEKPIDFDRAHEILQEEKEKSLSWLKEALESPPISGDMVEQETENVITYLKKELEGTKHLLKEERRRVQPLANLNRVNKNIPISAKSLLTRSFVIRNAFRMEYWRCRLLGRILPQDKRQYCQDRIRAIRIAASMLFHKKKSP